MINALNATKFSRISQWRMSFFQIAASISGRRSGGWSHAQRAFRLLPGGVGADGWSDVDRAGVDLHLAAVDGEVEAVEATRSGARLLLADAVVLRAVAGAF